MTSMEIGKELVALCKQGKNKEATDRLYSPTVLSVEPVAMPGMERVLHGIQAIQKKKQWWIDNHDITGT